MKSTLARRNVLGGIYMIKNEKNGKIYIGQSYDFELTRKSTFDALKNGRHTNKDLQRDFDAGCRFGFTFLHVEIHKLYRYREGQRSKLQKLARQYIAEYDSINNGYNRPIGPGPNRWPNKSMVE